MTQDDRAYCLQCAAEERAIADAVANPAVAHIHQAMAELYEARKDEPFPDEEEALD